MQLSPRRPGPLLLPPPPPRLMGCLSVCVVLLMSHALQSVGGNVPKAPLLRSRHYYAPTHHNSGPHHYTW